MAFKVDADLMKWAENMFVSIPDKPTKYLMHPVAVELATPLSGVSERIRRMQLIFLFYGPNRP